MKSFFSKTLILIALLAVFSCKEKPKNITIAIKNTLDIARSFETVELSKADLNIEDLSQIGIKNQKTGELQISQLVDQDGDSIFDVLLFQPKIEAHSETIYEVIDVNHLEIPKSETWCYSRIVPERTDDYTWENNRVAFRVFGPKAQKMVEDSIPGGTLSSGVDAWLKKVDYPIINKWYKKELETDGSYHEDTGEGLDNFHVGVSRGVGGIAVKVDSTYFFSKNFVKWRTIATGPIRTCFYLEYEDWDAAGHTIKESKTISLDFGSNLSKFETRIEGVNQIAAGLTLHEKDGKVTGNSSKGWVSYWQPHGDSELGTALVANKGTFLGFVNYDSEVRDLSNAYAHLKVDNNEVAYYAGFGWKESGQFKDQQEWEHYLNTFSEQINNPLVVKITN